MSRAQGSCRGRRNPQKRPPSAHLLWEQWEKQRSRSRGGLCPLPPAWVTRAASLVAVPSTPAGSEPAPLTHLWLQVLLDQVLPAFLPLLVRSHLVPGLHRANTVRGRPSRNPALLPGDSEAQPQLGAPGKPSRPHSPRGDRDVPVLTTASRKLTQRASSGRVSQNCRNSARPMGCLSHRLW